MKKSRTLILLEKIQKDCYLYYDHHKSMLNDMKKYYKKLINPTENIIIILEEQMTPIIDI